MKLISLYAHGKDSSCSTPTKQYKTCRNNLYSLQGLSIHVSLIAFQCVRKTISMILVFSTCPNSDNLLSQIHSGFFLYEMVDCTKSRSGKNDNCKNNLCMILSLLNSINIPDV